MERLEQQLLIFPAKCAAKEGSAFKRLFSVLTALILAAVLSLPAAASSVSLSMTLPESTPIARTFAASVSITGDTPVSAVHLDLTYGDYFTLKSASLTETGHIRISRGDGHSQMICIFDEPIKSGDFLTLELTASAGKESGDREISLDVIQATEESYGDVYVEGCAFVVSVKKSTASASKSSGGRTSSSANESQQKSSRASSSRSAPGSSSARASLSAVSRASSSQSGAGSRKTKSSAPQSEMISGNENAQSRETPDADTVTIRGSRDGSKLKYTIAGGLAVTGAAAALAFVYSLGKSRAQKNKTSENGSGSDSDE